MLDILLLLAAFLSPLFSFILLFFSPLPRKWVYFVSLMANAISLGLFFCLGDVQGLWGVIFLDKTAFVMLRLVCFIALLVQIFSVVYMAHEVHYKRYFAYLSLFVFTMLGLLATNHLLLIYIFWELVGFCSYLLIGFWHQKEAAGKASKNAFLINRIGDTGFLIAICLFYAHTNSFLLSQIPNIQGDIQFWIGLCFLLGALGKSAQFPLHTWLPDAMAGPTPISALIHAATMVAAGVYLLYRTFAIFTPEILIILALVGSLTAFLGAFSALLQNDIKKVLAYSTISQLGYMFAGIGLGSPESSFLHLTGHAFFKACLFLSAGAVIHQLHHWAEKNNAHFDTQDMQNMGGLYQLMPWTMYSFAISALALMGVPLTVGFVSKEGILEASIHSNLLKISTLLYVVPFLLWLSLGLTAFYTTRQFLLIFMGKNRFVDSQNISFEHFPPEPLLFKIPLALLALLSVNLFFWDFPWHGSAFMAICLTILGVWIAYKFYQKDKLNDLTLFNVWVTQLSLQSFYIAQLYDFLGRKLINLVKKIVHFETIMDKSLVNTIRLGLVIGHIASWIDYFLVDGLVRFLVYFVGLTGKITKRIQGGIVQNYFAASILFMLILLYFWLF